VKSDFATGIELAQEPYRLLSTYCKDHAGSTARILPTLEREMRINVIDVRHQRISSHLPIMQREETLTLKTRDRAQCEQLLQTLRSAGYVVEEAQAW
jgi:threonine dehydratase